MSVLDYWDFAYSEDPPVIALKQLYIFPINNGIKFKYFYRNSIIEILHFTTLTKKGRVPKRHRFKRRSLAAANSLPITLKYFIRLNLPNME